jgi:hypothetical protein
MIAFFIYQIIDMLFFSEGFAVFRDYREIQG